MRRRLIIGLAALLTITGLGLALLAVVRRHRAELRLAELAATDRAIQAAILRSRTPAATPGHSGGNPREEPPRRTVAGQSEAEAPARPDLDEIFSAHPELRAAYLKATAGRLHQTYDRLWGRLGLSSAQIEQAISILMRDDENEIDLAMTARSLKLAGDDPALQRFRREEMAETQSALESVLGSQAYQALRDYNRILLMRATAEDVASLAAVSESPLTGAQTEQLTRLLAEASAGYRNGGRPNLASTDWESVLDQASAFLAPPQLAALQAKAQQARTAAMLSQFYAARGQH